MSQSRVREGNFEIPTSGSQNQRSSSELLPVGALSSSIDPVDLLGQGNTLNGTKGARTPNLLRAKQMPYQLSYDPLFT